MSDIIVLNIEAPVLNKSLPTVEEGSPDDSEKLMGNNGTGTSEASGTLSKTDTSALGPSTTEEKTVLVSATASIPEGTASTIEMPPRWAANKESLASVSTATQGDETRTSLGIPTHERLNKVEKRLVFASLCMGMFLAALDQMIVIVCLPTIVKDLGGAQYLAWVLSAYLLTSSATMPLYGKFSDIHGRRVTYLLSLTLFLGGSLACGFATGIWYLIGFRGLQGLGGGGLMSLSVILIGDIAKPASRAKYMSSVTGIFGVATVVGPVLGGFFTDYVSWRWVFFINLPFGAVTFVVCWIVLKKIRNAQKELAMDFFGSIFIFSGTACLVLLVTWGGVNYAWDSWEILFLIFLSAALFALFVVQEFRHSEPILNLRLFNIRNFAVACYVMFFFGMAMFGGFTFLPIYFQNVRGDSAIISGLKLVPMVMGMMFASITAGVYVSKTGNFVLFPKIGMALLSIGEGLLAIMNETMSYGIEWILLFIMGIGMGLTLPVFSGIVQNSVPVHDMASSMAAVTFIRSIGGSLGIAIFGSILNQKTTSNIDDGDSVVVATTKALQLVFLCAMAPALLGFVIVFFLKKTDVFARKKSGPVPIME